jgi:hypothetical protein
MLLYHALRYENLHSDFTQSRSDKFQYFYNIVLIIVLHFLILRRLFVVIYGYL